MTFRFALLAPLVMAACTQFPELEGAISADVAQGDYPDFLPTAQFSQAGPAPRQSATDQAALIARATRLSRRAQALRGPVIDRTMRARLAAATR